MLIALTRAVSPELGRCELTHRARVTIDPLLAAEQHGDYERVLQRLGCTIVRAGELPEHPDGVFVEDTAIVLDELAVVTIPGASSRRGEAATTAHALEAYRTVVSLEAPAALDGGDVLRLGRVLHVGRSGRTNEEAIAQLRRFVEPLGYRVSGASVTGCLHLKSAVTAIGPMLILANPAWTDLAQYAGCEVIEVDPTEPDAANVLAVGGVVMTSAAYPRTRARLESRGIRTEAVDVSELAKAEGALTCCSIVFES